MNQENKTQEQAQSNNQNQQQTQANKEDLQQPQNNSQNNAGKYFTEEDINRIVMETFKKLNQRAADESNQKAPDGHDDKLKQMEQEISRYKDNENASMLEKMMSKYNDTVELQVDDSVGAAYNAFLDNQSESVKNSIKHSVSMSIMGGIDFLAKNYDDMMAEIKKKETDTMIPRESINKAKTILSFCEKWKTAVRNQMQNKFFIDFFENRLDIKIKDASKADLAQSIEPLMDTMTTLVNNAKLLKNKKPMSKDSKGAYIDSFTGGIVGW